MRRIITIFLIILILVVIFSPAGFSAYLIRLKSGGQIITSHYWEKEGQIMFNYLDGVAGIQEDSVQSITKIGTTERSVVSENMGEMERPQQISVETQEKTKTTPGPAKDDRDKDALLKEFRLIKERFQRVQGMTKGELKSFAKEMTALMKKIIRSGWGEKFNKEFQEIYDMTGEIEVMIREKGQ